MKNKSLNISSHNWPAKWYLGFFIIIVASFVALVFFQVRKQAWDTFDYKISLLGEEMLEELEDFRDTQNIITEDSVFWTSELLEKVADEIAQEIIDETMDNQLKDLSLVQIKNLVSGRVIYQDREISQHGIQFYDTHPQYLGYQRFKLQSSEGKLLNGVGYTGVRINKHYFVGVVEEQVSSAEMEENVFRKFKELTRRIGKSVKRKADLLFVENDPRNLIDLKQANAWAYVCIGEDDTLIWASRSVTMSQVYVPPVLADKEFYRTIEDQHNHKFRQYTLVHDEYTNYLYLINLAVPLKSLQRSLIWLAISLVLGALLLIVIVWGGGNLLMRRALRPIDEIINSVNEITSKNLDRRLPVVNVENEILRLVHTFNELLDRLAKAFQMQKAFIADASHELLTPLSILMSDIETALKELKEKSRAKNSLLNAVNEIDRIARIVDDLHWLAKSDSGQMSIKKREIRLDDVLMATLSRCQVLASQRKIKLSVQNIDIIEFKGDEELLIRAFSNVVTNAIKYSKHRGLVRLSLFKENCTAKFMVEDNGIGIPPDSTDKIFDRFYRIDSSRSRETGGSGLGLAIAKWICELHSGIIKVASEENIGSTFTIELPLVSLSNTK